MSAAIHERIEIIPVDADVVSVLAEEMDIPPVVAKILINRGIVDSATAIRFMRPSLDQLLDPFLFSQMNRAVDRVLQAVDKNESVVVYGDYDVDGVAGTSILVRMLRLIGVRCDYFLPNRITQGYGMSTDAMDLIAAGGATLIVAVDCGITSFKEVEYAAQKGIECIILDHHEPKEKLPPAYAIIDPKTETGAYRDSCLCGAGVAFKLCQAISRKKALPDETWLQFLDLAALATAADIVPLTGENRIIVTYGFNRMRKTSNIGLAALLDAQGAAGKTVTTREVVFGVAPCINAAGRLGDSTLGVKLLLTTDPVQAREYAIQLKDANLERRAIDVGVQKSALEWIAGNIDVSTSSAIVVGSRDWHCGVVGIVASKLVEQFHRPAIVFSIDEHGCARGSGRSISAVHLLDALGKCSDIIERFGGHAAAAGLSIHEDKIDEFRIRFCGEVAKMITPDDMVPRVVADAEIGLSDLTWNLHQQLGAMEPFGPGNRRPVFVTRGLKNRYEPKVVGAKHLKLKVTKGVGPAATIDAIGFNFGDRVGEVRYAPDFGLAYSLEENEWNGVKSLQLNVKGVEV